MPVEALTVAVLAEIGYSSSEMAELLLEGAVVGDDVNLSAFLCARRLADLAACVSEALAKQDGKLVHG